MERGEGGMERERGQKGEERREKGRGENIALELHHIICKVEKYRFGCMNEPVSLPYRSMCRVGSSYTHHMSYVSHEHMHVKCAYTSFTPHTPHFNE